MRRDIKIVYNELSGIFTKPALGVFVLVWLVLCGTSMLVLSTYKTFTINEALLDTFGGLKIDPDSAGLDFLRLSVWMLGIAPIVIQCGIYFGNELKARSMYTVYRIGGYARWWRTKMAAVIISCGLYFAIGMLIDTGFAVLFGAHAGGTLLTANAAILIYPLWPVHAMFLSILVCMLFILTGSQISGIVVFLVVEGMTAVLGYAVNPISRYMPGCWGMALRTIGQNSRYGLNPSVILIVQIIFLLVLWVLGPALVRAKSIASGRSLS